MLILIAITASLVLFLVVALMSIMAITHSVNSLIFNISMGTIFVSILMIIFLSVALNSLVRNCSYDQDSFTCKYKSGDLVGDTSPAKVEAD